MQKTTNYNLNQWEATDPIRREDFNADNAAIDAALGAAYSATNVPWEVGTVDLTGADFGTVLKTFDYTPSAIFLFNTNSVPGIAPNGSMAVVVSRTTLEEYWVFRLQDTILKVTGQNGTIGTTLYYLALK